MKRIVVLLSLLFVLSIALFGCNKKENQAAVDASWTNVQKKGTFILGFDDAFPPMGFKDNGIYVGFDIDLAQEVTKRLNLKLVLQPIIWDVKEQELNTKKIDCIWNGFSITPERKEALAFTRPYMNNKQIIVVKADSPINVLTDLDGKRLALQRDSSASDALDKTPYLRSSLGSVLEFEDNIMAMTDLDTNNNDAVLMDIVVANYNFIAKNPGKYRTLEQSLADEEFGIGFRKDDLSLKDKVEATLLEMANDGTVAKISQKWFGSDITTLK